MEGNTEKMDENSHFPLIFPRPTFPKKKVLPIHPPTEKRLDGCLPLPWDCRCPTHQT